MVDLFRKNVRKKMGMFHSEEERSDALCYAIGPFKPSSRLPLSTRPRLCKRPLRRNNYERRQGQMSTEALINCLNAPI